MFPGDAERTEYFMQWLAPPTPGKQNSSTKNGKTQFTNAGLRLLPYHFVHDAGDLAARRWATSPSISIPIILVHHMGPGLADGLAQGRRGSG